MRWGDNITIELGRIKKTVIREAIELREEKYIRWERNQIQIEKMGPSWSHFLTKNKERI